MGTYTGSDKRLQYLFQNGGGGGGGTNVEANPQGTPTDWLNSLKVGNLIYSVAKVGDCYSTTERQVGCYTDGKPLYQKTVDMGTLSTGSYKTVLYSDIGISNIEHVAYIDIVINDTYNVNFNRPDNVNTEFYSQLTATGIFLRAYNTPVTRAIATIQYTKSTDTAGSGIWTPSGSYAHHYTTDEQIIGTYLGQTLYEKTFTTSPISIASNSNTVITLSDYGISNVSKIIKIEGCDDTLNLPIPYIAMSSGTRYEITIASSNTTTLIVSRTGGAISNQVFTITLQYTKT